MERSRTRPKATSTGDTVTVACKLPNGLVLRLFNKMDISEPVMGGGFRDVKQFVPRPGVEPVTIHGNRYRYGELPPYQIVGGYGLTEGVSKEFWEEWLSQNPQLEVITNNLVFAYPTLDGAKKQAESMDEITSGLQPMAQGEDARAPRRIAKADEQKTVAR